MDRATATLTQADANKRAGGRSTPGKREAGSMAGAMKITACILCGSLRSRRVAASEPMLCAMITYFACGDVAAVSDFATCEEKMGV